MFTKEIKKLHIKIAKQLRASVRYRNTVRELSQLNDRDLADIGLTRSDIHRVAAQGTTRLPVNA